MRERKKEKEKKKKKPPSLYPVFHQCIGRLETDQGPPPFLIPPMQLRDMRAGIPLVNTRGRERLLREDFWGRFSCLARHVP